MAHKRTTSQALQEAKNIYAAKGGNPLKAVFDATNYGTECNGWQYREATTALDNATKKRYHSTFEQLVDKPETRPEEITAMFNQAMNDVISLERQAPSVSL